jgi:hypothetical protein
MPPQQISGIIYDKGDNGCFTAETAENAEKIYEELRTRHMRGVR